jgi:hypothetical protein
VPSRSQVRLAARQRYDLFRALSASPPLCRSSWRPVRPTVDPVRRGNDARGGLLGVHVGVRGPACVPFYAMRPACASVDLLRSTTILPMLPGGGCRPGQHVSSQCESPPANCLACRDLELRVGKSRRRVLAVNPRGAADAAAVDMTRHPPQGAAEQRRPLSVNHRAHNELALTVYARLPWSSRRLPESNLLLP